MLSLQTILSAINNTNDSSDLYLLEQLSVNAGFFISNKKLHYMVKDDLYSKSNSLTTEYLCLQTHVSITSAENNPSFKSGFYNIITYNGNLENDNIKTLVQLCEIHSLNTASLPFEEFFNSLIDLFQIPSTEKTLNTIGLYGELKFMETIYHKYGIDLSLYWHKNGIYSQYDIVSDIDKCIEIKTTASEDKFVTIKHEQIFNQSACMLAVVEVDDCEDGETLDELVSKLENIKSAFNSLQFRINLAKEIARLSPITKGNLILRLTDIKCFNNTDINPFPILPDNVTNLVYKFEYSQTRQVTTKSLGIYFSNFND